MFNELLTGQTDGQRPAPQAPPPIVDETRSCAECGRAFVIKSNMPHTKCGPCNLPALEADQRANHDIEKAIWQRRQRKELLAALILIPAVILFIVLAMQRSERHSQRIHDYDCRVNPHFCTPD